MHPNAPASVGVIGGGTAGYFTAIALKRRFPDLAVTVVESKNVPIIGVGEATTTLMPPFLHRDLGLDVDELFAAVSPTFKLGIRFDWGLPEGSWFAYAFGAADPIGAHANEGTLDAQSLTSLLMRADRFPILRGPDGELLSLLSRLKFAYHLHNAPFVALLARHAARMGVAHADFPVAAVARGEGGAVAAITSADGRELRFDLFVDATGFRSLLLEGALGSPFESYASSLFCDRAVVADAPLARPIRPYTTATTMSAGWCWGIPTMAGDHHGYVHSSAHLSEDAALAELRALVPGVDAAGARVVRFRSGRHREFWLENVVAMGNAYAFVEPLESTGLHMAIVQIAYLLEGVAALRSGTFEGYRAFANDAVARHWDYLRWFLAIHYRFNERSPSPFWRSVRATADVSGFADVLARFRDHGPWTEAEGRRFTPGDPSFGYSGLMTMLLGQRVPGSEHARSPTDPEDWAATADRYRRLTARALTQDEGLALLGEDAAMRRDMVAGRGAWCAGDQERAIVSWPAGATVHPRRG